MGAKANVGCSSGLGGAEQSRAQYWQKGRDQGHCPRASFGVAASGLTRARWEAVATQRWSTGWATSSGQGHFPGPVSSPPRWR